MSERFKILKRPPSVGEFDRFYHKGRHTPGDPRADGLVSTKQAEYEHAARGPQFVEDQHCPSYRNDIPTSRWVAGANGDATRKPYFDHAPKRGHERFGGNDGVTEGLPISRLPDEDTYPDHTNGRPDRLRYRDPTKGSGDFSHGGVPGREHYSMKHHPDGSATARAHGHKGGR
ncbi:MULTISPECIES: hypothetical protein [unclassified Bradyrhizobium]|uniref:hypothetical protein n=1 Tax=unclassified Bradyrhizobium TaxID=2631580 RepID=UPI0029163AB6|nr:MULTISPECIES: hypothetical protein [unclassified Bradyrhizobium]